MFSLVIGQPSKDVTENEFKSIDIKKNLNADAHLCTYRPSQPVAD